MKLIAWNVNSIRTRLARLLGVLDRHKPDVVCLQELKADDLNLPIAEIRDAGYHFTFFAQKTYNGVAILSKSEPASITRGFADGAPEDPQTRLIRANIDGIRIMSAYFPNGSTVGSDKWAYKLAWINRLRAALDAQESPRSPFILAGDFNVAVDDKDVAFPEKWDTSVLFHPEARAALDHIRGFGFTDTFRAKHPDGRIYSWWDYRQLAFPKGDGLRIDHIFATSPIAERCTAASIDRDERKGQQPSDHAPVIAEFAP